MLRRPLLLTLVCLLLVPALSRAANVEFVRVWPAWREAASFERITEYFGGSENTGREITLRTQDDTRDGYYFLVRVKNAGAALAKARFELQVIRPDSPRPLLFTFPVALETKQVVFQLGLTGAAWPGGAQAHPVAWRLALVSSDDQVLAEQKSFLWEKPAK